MMHHWIDYAILGIIVLSVITGVFRGFVKELIALGVWILAIWMAFHYSQTLAPYLEPYVHDKMIRSAIAVVIILFGTLIVGSLFNAFLSFILHRTGLSGTDRLLGMGFGFIRGIFIVSLLILIVNLTATSSSMEYRKQSQLYAYFDPVVHWLDQFTPVFMKQMKTLDQSTTSPQGNPTLPAN
jgi:membrane protein required for colicin V production